MNRLKNELDSLEEELELLEKEEWPSNLESDEGTSQH